MMFWNENIVYYAKNQVFSPFFDISFHFQMLRCSLFKDKIRLITAPPMALFRTNIVAVCFDFDQKTSL